MNEYQGIIPDSGSAFSDTGQKRLMFDLTSINFLKGKVKSFALLFLVGGIGFSCGSYKNIPYFKDLNRDSLLVQQVNNYSPLTIQPADILGINVNSRNPESSAVFNNSQGAVNGTTNGQTSTGPFTGYQVDQKGDIHLPLIGNLKAGGLTTAELREKMDQILLTYYKDPVVNIRILNFRVSVYGDVQRPDIYTLQNERTTITQVLSLAGDLNITAMRNNIVLIREQDGKRNFIHVDLTSKDLFNSPYYYLKNNDEIYVQPDRTKYATVDRGYRITTLVLSGLSIIAIVLSNLYR